MNITHHPEDSTILAYTASSLIESFNLVVAAHAEQCTSCRRKMVVGENLGGQLLMDLTPAEMDTGGFDNLWQRIQNKQPETGSAKTASGVSTVLASYLSGDLASVPWRSLAPGIRHYPLRGISSGKGSARLLAIAPGKVIPEHTHRGGELTLILQGSYEDEIGQFSEGDIADLDSSVHHSPTISNNETCICLIATDEPLQFSGILSRLIQPVINI